MKLIYQPGKKNQKINVLFWKEQDILSNNNIRIIKKELQLLKPSYPEIKKKEEKEKRLKWIIIIKL